MNKGDTHCLKEKDVYSIVLIWERFLLTIKEASLYFNFGENKMHRIANEYVDSDYKFVVQNGGWTMIKRKLFEDFQTRLHKYRYGIKANKNGKTALGVV